MLRSCLATTTAAAAPFILIALIAVAACASACGSKPEPMTPSLSDPAHAADPAAAGSAAMPAASADPEAASGAAGNDDRPHRQRKPFPIHSSCSDVVTIVFGEDPKAQGAGRRTVAPNSAIDGPRDSEGKQTVWLLDDKGEPTVKVHITRGMKQLEIGRSCRTLDAH
jgi:hypothetical protein